jgi:hypothetical protein
MVLISGAGHQDAGDIPKIVSADSIHWESEARAEGTWFRREFKELHVPAVRWEQGSVLRWDSSPGSQTLSHPFQR